MLPLDQVYPIVFITLNKNIYFIYVKFSQRPILVFHCNAILTQTPWNEVRFHRLIT